MLEFHSVAQHVLRCGRCNKPFDKEATLKRHGYYCRSRVETAAHRRQSCVACAKAKARCDKQRPECSRCSLKAINCCYSNAKASPTISNGQGDNSAESSPSDLTFVSSSEPIASMVDDNADTVNDILFDPMLEALMSDLIQMDGKSFDNSINLIEDETTHTSNDDTQIIVSQPALQIQPPWDARQLRQVQRALCSPNALMADLPTHTLLSFEKRPKIGLSASRTTDLVLHTLRSYPVAMLRNDALPPFIHPQLISSDFEDNEVECLLNCRNLIRMLAGGVSGSRRLFWRNVQMECEIMRADCANYNKWQSLAALQALLIYILVRLGEVETSQNSLDFLLITTVVMLSLQLYRVSTNELTLQHNGNDYQSAATEWKDWIFGESLARLCVIYQVIDMLVYFEPAAMCDIHHRGLVIAPLPASKQQWDASNASSWKQEYEQSSRGSVPMFGLAANGDLVRIEDFCADINGLNKSSTQRSVTARAQNSRINWEEWCSSMDGLGGLVMLAASLVG